MIVDVITYNGEEELFELRYDILKDYVDEFIVVEFDKTFSGKPKPYLFHPHIYNDIKIRYFPIPEKIYSKYKELAESSPNTKGADHWKTEFMQKESIKDALTHLKDDDICFIGDVDEIWNPETNWKAYGGSPFKLRLDVYTYYLNNRSSEEFWGTLYCSYSFVKDSCLNHLRTNTEKTKTHNGWHFTSLRHGLRKKLTDSYTNETYANEVVLAYLDKNIAENKDFLGREFTYIIDEEDWPQYLKDNREKFAHLLK